MTVKGRNEGRLRNENIFAAFARQPLLLHKTIKSYNPLVMAFPKHHPPSLCSQYSQTEILRISFVFGQKNQNKNSTFLCVFRIGFPFAKLLRNFCERKRKFGFLCATFLRENTLDNFSNFKLLISVLFLFIPQFEDFVTKSNQLRSAES